MLLCIDNCASLLTSDTAAAIGISRVACDGAAVNGQRAEVVDTATAVCDSLVASDGNTRERSRSALGVEDTTAASWFDTVVTLVVGNGTAYHGERASVTDAAATIVGMVAGDGDVSQVRRTALVGDTATVAAPAARERTVRELEGCAIAHGDDLTAAFATLRQFAVQCVTPEVDGHLCTFCDTQRTVAELDVVNQTYACTIGDGATQFRVVGTSVALSTLKGLSFPGLSSLEQAVKVAAIMIAANRANDAINYLFFMSILFFY